MRPLRPAHRELREGRVGHGRGAAEGRRETVELCADAQLPPQLRELRAARARRAEP